MESITFSKNTETINPNVCYGDTALTSVTIPEGVKEILQGAFQACTSLSSLYLPTSLVKTYYAVDDSTTLISASSDFRKMGESCYRRVTGVTVYLTEYYQLAFQVLELVNKERAKEGRDALVMDESLLTSAMIRAAEIRVAFSHTRPCLFDCFSINTLMYGENIAAGQTSPEEAMSWWMNSTGHRENILSERYTTIGIGCVKVGNTYYWTQCFGKDGSSEAKASSYQDRDLVQTVYIASDSSILTSYLAHLASLKDDEEETEAEERSTTSSGTVKKPGKVTIKKAKRVSTGKIRVRWKKVSGADGYQVVLARNAKFTKGVKKVFTTKLTCIFSRLSRKKAYYVRVRAYKILSNGKKKYGSFGSKVKISKISK
jgi:uncharacterized protein YkwD